MKEFEPTKEDVTFNVTCNDCPFFETAGTLQRAVDLRQEHLKENRGHLSVVISEVPNNL